MNSQRSPARLEGVDPQGVELHRNRLLYGSLARSVAASMVLASALAITLAMLPGGSWPRSIVWLLAMGLVGAARLQARADHRINGDDPARAREFGRRYALGASAAGAMWGTGALFLFPADLVSQAFVGFVFAGVSSGAITTLGPSRWASRGFLSLALLPLAVRLIVAGGPVPIVMGAMTIAFLVYLLASSYQLQHTIDENFRLRLTEAMTEASLRRQKDLLERVGSIAAVGGWRFVPATGEMEWSDQVYRIFGRDPSDPLDYDSVVASYPGDARHRVEAGILRALEEGEPFDLEVPFQSNDGRSLWVRVQGQLDASAEGDPALIGAFQDITDRRVARDALSKNLRALERLHRISASPTAKVDAKLGDLLDLGLEIFGLDLAIISRIEGNQYTIRVARSATGDAPPPGTVFSLGDTYCVHALAADEPVSFHEAGNSEIQGHPCYAKFGLESYIGSPLMVDGVRFGTVSFSAAAKKEEPFTEADHTLMQTFAEWVGHELERDQFLSQLAESEQRIRLLLESVGEGVYGLDLDGRTTFANPAALSILGYTAEELLGAPMHSLIHHSHRNGDPYPVEDCPIHDTLTRGVVNRSTDILWPAGGVAVPVEVTSTPIRRDGELVGAVVAFRDITKREDYERRLTSTLAMQSAILDSTSYAIIATDEDGTISNFSRGAERMLGWSEDEVVGKVTPLSFHDESELSDFVEAEGAAEDSPFALFAAHSMEHGIFEHEWTYVRRDGTRLPVLLTVTPIRAEGTATLGHLFVAADLTERKRVDRLKNEFVSTVSHELRTPLTSIRGSLGLVAGGAAGKLPERAQSLVAIASRNSERLIFLINDILDMEKIESGKMEFAMSVQPLQPLIRQSVESNTAFASEHRVTLSVEMPEQEILVNVDENRLIQILTNLISNAAKFSPAGESVDVAVSYGGKGVRIAVQDRGPGIAEEFRPRIFDKFSQADASDRRAKGGTGLGLSITRALVQQMHGVIDFDTEEGAGTTFWVELPIASQVHFQPVAHDSGEIRLLICCAEPEGGDAFQAMLEEAGYQVTITESSYRFREMATTAPFDAFLIDLALDNGEGLGLVQWLRARPESALTPIIAVSARLEEDHLALKGNIPVLNLMAKPIDSGQLIATLQGIEKRSDGQLPLVLHVEDDPDLQEFVAELGRTLARFQPVGTIAAARQALTEFDFQLILLDIGLPDGSGWDILEPLQKLERSPPIVVFSATPVGASQARQVEATLLKSQTSEQNLLATLERVLNRQREDRAE